MMRRELTDREWERLLPLLPSQKPRVGRPAKDHRIVINAILWILRTGAPWRDLPRAYGSWKTVYSRFRRWQEVGIWQKLWKTFQRQADAEGDLDWEIHFVDSTVVRVHQHAAGAKGGRKTRLWAGAEEDSAPRCTFGLRDSGSPWCSCSRVGSATRKWPSSASWRAGRSSEEEAGGPKRGHGVW